METNPHGLDVDCPDSSEQGDKSMRELVTILEIKILLVESFWHGETRRQLGSMMAQSKSTIHFYREWIISMLSGFYLRCNFYAISICLSFVIKDTMLEIQTCFTSLFLEGCIWLSCLCPLSMKKIIVSEVAVSFSNLWHFE